MKFGKETIKRGMAGGLIALMIASNVACDKKETSANDWMKNEQINGHSVMDMNSADAMEMMGHNTDNPYCAEYRALPLKTLEKLGYVETDTDGHRCLKDMYHAGLKFIYADVANSKIGMIVSIYRSGRIGTEVHHLEYENISTEDMKLFKTLDGARLRKFIQGVDAQYSVRDSKKMPENTKALPYGWIEDFNPDTFDITLCEWGNEGLVSYTYNLLTDTDSNYATKDEAKAYFEKGLGWDDTEFGRVYSFDRVNFKPDTTKVEPDIIIPNDDLILDYLRFNQYDIGENVEQNLLS